MADTAETLVHHHTDSVVETVITLVPANAVADVILASQIEGTLRTADTAATSVLRRTDSVAEVAITMVPVNAVANIILTLDTETLLQVADAISPHRHTDLVVEKVITSVPINIAEEAMLTWHIDGTSRVADTVGTSVLRRVTLIGTNSQTGRADVIPLLRRIATHVTAVNILWDTIGREDAAVASLTDDGKLLEVIMAVRLDLM